VLASVASTDVVGISCVILEVTEGPFNSSLINVVAISFELLVWRSPIDVVESDSVVLKDTERARAGSSLVDEGIMLWEVLDS